MEPERLYKTIALEVAAKGRIPSGLKDRIPAEWKAEMDADENVIVGYASTFGGPPDFGGDIVVKGAFAKTIQERVPAGKVPISDGHNYDARSIVGIINAAQEDDIGLLVKGRFSAAPSAQEVKTKVLEGIISGFSIGYKALKVDFQRWETEGEWKGEVIRLLETVRLDEVALTALPMNEAARVLAVKSVQALPFAALPLAPVSTPWDPEAAAARVREFGKAQAKPTAKAMAAFLAFNQSKAESMDACSGLVADIVAGELKAVPAAIYGLAAEALEARLSLKSADLFPDSVLNHLGKYLTLLGEAVPWRQSSLDAAILRAKGGVIDTQRLARGQEQIKRFLSDTAGPGQPPTAENDEARIARIRALAGEPKTEAKAQDNEQRAERLAKAAEFIKGL